MGHNKFSVWNVPSDVSIHKKTRLEQRPQNSLNNRVFLDKHRIYINVTVAENVVIQWKIIS